MSYFENSKEVEVVSLKIDVDDAPKGQCYSAKFVTPGLVKYSDSIYYLPKEALDKFAWKLKGCPVIVGHQDILDHKDMLEKAVGYVSNVRKGEFDDSWFCDFVIFCEKTIKKIKEGDTPYVSFGYKAVTTEKGGTHNNIDYKKEILDGEMIHLALVKNPRYSDTDIWMNSKDDYILSESVLYNSEDNKMFGFKKAQVELDKETLVSTKRGDLTLEQLVNELEAADEALAAKVEELAVKEAEIVTLKEAAEAVVEPAPEVAEGGTDATLKEQLENSVNAGGPVVRKIVVSTIDDKLMK